MFPQPEHPILLRHSNHVQAPPHNLRALLHLSFVSQRCVEGPGRYHWPREPANMFHMAGSGKHA